MSIFSLLTGIKACATRHGSTKPVHRPVMRRFLLGTSALVAAATPLASHAADFPTGGTFVAGAGNIDTAGRQMTIVTGSERSVIDWSSFSIAADHGVRIDQPNARSINVNRVTGADPSRIFGSLASNGRLVLANPNGIWFGPSANVDVAGIVASAGRITDASAATFGAGGTLRIDAGRADASIINEGTISVSQGGLAALVAPGVRNSGIISARLGQVKLASGLTTTLDFYGDGLINLAVGEEAGGRATDASGTALDATVSNKGSIFAEGGQVQLSAGAASGVLDNVINMSGAIEARGISTAGGVVELTAGAGSIEVAGKIDVGGSKDQAGGRVTIKAGTDAAGSGGVIALAGDVSASGSNGAGGTVEVEGRFVHLGGALHADGATGGKISVAATGVTQSGVATADGAAQGGIVDILGLVNVTQALSAKTSANAGAGAGGVATVRSGPAGRTFSSGTITATGQAGGTVKVLGNDIALAAAKLDASGTGAGGAVLVGGDLHGGEGQRAATTLVNASTTLDASARDSGNGGRVVAWSDKTTTFQGSAKARGGVAGGDGGMIETSSAGLLDFSGAGDAGAARGKAGTLLLDPKDIVISDSAGGLAVFDLVDPNAGQGSGFGTMTVQQGNGNIIVTKPNDDVAGAAGAGSVYFYDSTNGGLIGAFQGTHAGDNVGLGNGASNANGGDGLTFLNYARYYDYYNVTGIPTYDGTAPFLIRSPNWNGAAGAITYVGANGTINGVLSSTNSLVGGSAGDNVGTVSGYSSIYQLPGDNYVVLSPDWSDQRGAATFGTATAPLTGVVSAANSMVGTLSRTANGDNRSGDAIGSGGLYTLTNGNFLVLSPMWNKQGGAISFGSGTTGFAAPGAVSSANSLVGNGGVNYSAPYTYNGGGPTVYGFYNGDQVGASTGNIYELSNGNYVVASTGWGHGRGAVTLASGTSGITGVVSSANSLVGVTLGMGDTADGTNTYATDVFGRRFYYGGDAVGTGGIAELTNGSFVVRSPNWSTNRGATTFVASPTATLSGTVTGANSLVGTTPGSSGGYDGFHQRYISGGDTIGGVTPLANGNYVVSSSSWNGSRGAVTVVDGTSGRTVVGSNGSAGDIVSAANSLVGSVGGDSIGSGITPLAGTSDFIASSSVWSSGRGAVTRVSGTSGLAEAVSAANSLVGTTPYERSLLGADNVGSSVIALPNGAWVIVSPNWNKIRGAVTFVAAGGTITGNINAANSLVGAIGAVTGGVYCNTCDYSSQPAIFGGDQLGSGGINVLANGNFLINSPYWSAAKGAITYVNGTTGALVDGTGSLIGNVSAANSLVGDQSGTVYTSSYNNFGFNTIGKKYYVGGDRLGSTESGTPFYQLANGNFVLLNSHWHNDSGAATFGTADGKFGNGAAFAGVLGASNSLVGSIAATINTPANPASADVSLNNDGDKIGYYYYGFQELAASDFILYNDRWNGTRGAISIGNGTSGIAGVLGSGNSLVGSQVGDSVGIGGPYSTTVLPNGNLLFANTNWNGGAGAVTFAASGAPLTGVISAANSFVGNSGDQVGSGGITALANGDYVINSPAAFGGAGASTWSGTTGAITGTLDAINSYVGDANAQSGSMFSTRLANPESFLINLGSENSGRVVLGFTNPTLWNYARAPQAKLTIAPSLITRSLNTGTSVILQANNDITLDSAVIAAPGSTAGLTLNAGRSILVNSDIDLGNGSLTMVANDSAANGVVDAYRDAGAAEISFANGTTVSTGTGRVDITLAASTDKTNNAAGDITLGTINAARVSALNLGSANGALTTNGVITATDPGTSILLATGGVYANNAGTAALDPGAGRFLVYSADPRSNSLGGIVADGKYYGRTLPANPPASLSPADNLLLYSVVPLLTVTSNAAVGYGDAPSTLTAQISGYIDGDSALNAYTGTAALSTAYQAGNAVGGTYAIGVGAGTLASTLGYAFNFVDGTVSVTPKQLGLSLVGNVGKVYDGNNTASLSAGNYQLTGLFGTDGIDVTHFSGLYSTRNVGTGRLVSTVLGAGDFAANGGTLLSNYVLPTGNVSGNIGAITPASLVVSGVTASGRVYDGTTNASLFGGALSGVIGGDVVSLVAGTGSFTDKNVGSAKTIIAAGYGIAGADALNYTLSSQPAGLTASITPASLNLAGVTASGRDYDGTTNTPLSGGTLSGVIGSDVVSLIAGTGSFASKNVGASKAITVSGYAIAGADALNYVLSGQPTGLSASITPASLMLSGVTAQDRAYDGTRTAALSGGTLTGLIGGDVVNVVPGTGSFANRNVGTAKAINVSSFGIAGADAGNYVLSGQPTGLTASITPASLTLSGVIASGRVYDGTTDVALSGGTLSGVIGGDVVSLIAGSGSFTDKNVGSAKAISTTGYGIAGSDAINYRLTDQPMGLTAAITPASLILSGVTASGRVYDGTINAPLSGGTLSGVIGGDVVSLVTGTGSFANKNVGAGKAITVSGYGIAGADALNYALSGQPTGLSASITPASLILSGVVAQDRVYDGSTSAPLSGGTLSGLIAGDAISLVAGTGSFADKNVGIAKAVSVSAYGIAGADVGNYALSGQPTGLTASITPASLTLSGVTASGRGYDGTTSATLSGGTLAGIIGADAVGLVTGAGAVADKMVGVAKPVITSGYGLSGGDARNYMLAGQPASLTIDITPRTLALLGVVATDRAYDGTTAVALTGGTLNGIVAGDRVDLVAGTGSLANKMVGAGKAVTVTGYGVTGADAVNYALSGQPSGLTVSITPKALILAGVMAEDRAYDGTDVATLSGGELIGAVDGDVVSLVTGNGRFADKNVGLQKAISVSGYGISGLDAANYSLTGQPSSLSASVTPKALQLTGITTADRIYDGSTAVALAGGTLAGVVGTDDVAVIAGSGAVADKSAGNAKAVAVSGYGIGGADAGNYALAGQPAGLSVNIAAKTLLLSDVTAQNRIYDGTTTVALTGGTLSDVVAGDVVQLLGGTGSVADKNAGTGKAVTMASYGITGADAANYALAGQPSGLVVDIAVKALALSGVSAVDRIYDGSTVAALTGGMLDGVVANDQIALVAGNGSFADRNVGAQKAITVRGYGITGADAGNYSLIGQPAGLSASVTPATLTLNGVTALERAYDGSTVALLTGGTLQGIVTGDDVRVAAGNGRFADKNVGTAKAIVVGGYGISGADAGNYSLASQPSGLSASVTPRIVSVEGVSVASRAYDGSTAVTLAGGTAAGTVAGDDVTLATGNGTVADRNVGSSRPVTVTGYALTGSDARNYALSGQPAGLVATITPATVRVSFDGPSPISKTYDGSAAATLGSGSYRIEGLVDGETIAINRTSGIYASANAGSGIGVSTTLSLADYVAGVGTSLVSYALPTGTISQSVGTINPATLVVRANDQSKAAGDPLPVFTASYSGFVGGDTADQLDVKPTISTDATASSPGGLYPLLVSGGADPNYTLRYERGVLTITPVPVSVPLQALITSSLPRPLVARPVSGERNEAVAFGVGQSAAFIPAAVSLPSTLGANVSQSAIVEIDDGARGANAYANNFLDAVELEVQQ